MEKLWSAGAYYYGTSETVRNIFKISLQFLDTINMDIMRKALDITQKRYPYFSVKMVKTANNIQLEHNSLPWILKEGGDIGELGGKESDFHMIAFSCKENWLYADVFHGMTDANGVMNLLKTLCYYYCCDVYDENISSKGIWLAGENISPEETEDPYLKFMSKADDVIKTTDNNKTEYLSLSEENKYECTNPYVFRLEIPQEELMRYCAENNGTPATAIALISARAIKKLHKNSEKIIGCGMATDMRRILGTQNSHHSTLAIPILDFTEKIAESTFDMQGTAFRQQVMEKCGVDTLTKGIYASNMFYGYINSLGTLKEKLLTTRNVLKMKYTGPTVSISYAGKSDFGECGKYIKQIFTEAPGAGIIIELNAINDIFCLAFIQEWKERTYFEMFCKELEICSIKYTLKSEEPLKLAKMTEILA